MDVHHHEEKEQQQDGMYDEILKGLPPVDFGFAYGSGVFEQEDYAATSSQEADAAAGRTKSKPMLDLVLAVRNPIEWHRENLDRNWRHYSFLRYLGAERLGQIQEDYGAAIYYNTAVPIPSQPQRVMKYGVISTHALRQDLLEWRWMYAAGRMQKPVRTIKGYDLLHEPQQANLASATRAALLLLPESFSDLDLFTMIAGLSYRGDFRMSYFGEHPRKVQNIVNKNLAHFHRLYSPAVLAAVPSLSSTGADRTRFAQDNSPATRASLLGQLPLAVRQRLKMPRSLGNVVTGSAAGAGGAAAPPPSAVSEAQAAVRVAWERLPANKTGKMVKRAIHKVVARSSLTQGFKGIFTAGVWKAFVYGMKKIDKYRQGMSKIAVAQRGGGRKDV